MECIQDLILDCMYPRKTDTQSINNFVVQNQFNGILLMLFLVAREWMLSSFSTSSHTQSFPKKSLHCLPQSNSELDSLWLHVVIDPSLSILKLPCRTMASNCFFSNSDSDY